MKPSFSFSTLVLVLLSACGGGGGAPGIVTPGAGGGPGGPFDVVSARASGARAVDVAFSQPVDPASAGDVAAYAIPGLPVYSAAATAGRATVVLETGEQAGATYVVAAAASIRSGAGGALPGGRSATFAGGGRAPAAHETLDPPVASLADLQARGWAVEDDPAATNSPPSAWTVDAGTILQSSNIYGGDAGDRVTPAKPGTVLIHRGTAVASDHFVEATVQSADDDGLGLVVRYANAQNHYRFDWLSEGSRRQIVKVRNGVATRLAFDLEAYAKNRPYRLRFQAIGRRLCAFVDDRLVLSADDPDLAGGAAGLYCWGSQGLRFDDVRVQSAAPPLPPPAPGPPLPSDGRQRESAPSFTHGIAAGDPLPGGAILWARTSAAASVLFEVATSPDLAGARRTAAVATSAAGDFTAHVEATGLAPGTRYFYRAIASDPARPAAQNASAIGTFATAPDPARAQDVTFAYGADIAIADRSNFGIFDKIAGHAPALFLSLGDFPYADSAPAATAEPAYREKHKEVRAPGEVVRLLGRVPLVAVWDDHEIQNDWDGATDPARVALGIAAWRLFFPARPDASAAGGRGTWRSIRLGRDVEIFVLDCRSQRSANSAADGPTKTMLGAAQRAWLEAALLASRARFKIVATSVPLRYGTTGSDHWQGYATERTRLFDFIRLNAIAGVVFLAGDQHWAAVHRHPEGFVEVQACPTATGLRTPPATPDPHVVFIGQRRTFGLVRAIVTGPDPRVEIEIRDGADQVMWTEVVR